MYRQSPAGPSSRDACSSPSTAISPINRFSPSVRQHGVQLLAKEIRASVSRPPSSEGRGSPHPQARPQGDTSALSIPRRLASFPKPLENTRPITSLSVEEVPPEAPNLQPETPNPKSQTRNPNTERCARCWATWAWAITRRHSATGRWTAQSSTGSTPPQNFQPLVYYY